MADHTRNTLGAATKALTDVIAPSVDAADPLAREQLKLVVAYLEFVRDRIDLMHDRARFELGHAIDMASAVSRHRSALPDGLVEQLTRRADEGVALLARADAATTELVASRAELDAHLRDAVRVAGAADDPAAREVERAVLDLSGERIGMERAWYLPLGLDPRPAEVRPVETVLRPV